jgi:hypothetical protein
MRRVVSRELFAGLAWRPVVSPDGVAADVAHLGNGTENVAGQVTADEAEHAARREAAE